MTNNLTFNVAKVVGDINISERITLKENMTLPEFISAVTKIFDDKLVCKIDAETKNQRIITTDNPELTMIDHFLKSGARNEYYYHNNKGDLYIGFSEKTHNILNKINMENIEKRPTQEEEEDQEETGSLCEDCQAEEDNKDLIKPQEPGNQMMSKVLDLVKDIDLSDESEDTDEYSLSSDFDEGPDDLILNRALGTV